MDHHCPWVNNCVGEGNQKYFVLFTVSHYSLVFTRFLMFSVCSINRIISFSCTSPVSRCRRFTGESGSLCCAWDPSGARVRISLRRRPPFCWYVAFLEHSRNIGCNRQLLCMAFRLFSTNCSSLFLFLDLSPIWIGVICNIYIGDVWHADFGDLLGWDRNWGLFFGYVLFFELFG